jgi:RND family efflux transporter MFP subunit
VQIADAEVRVRRATVDELERRLADYRIVAPESGIIVTRMRDAGEWSAEGETVVTLLVMNPMRVRIEAPQADLPSIRAGQKARMRVDGLDGEAFEAEVVQIIPRARLATRNFPVLLQVNNESGRLAAGMFARVELNVGRERTGLAVPREAVQFRGLRRTIYRLDPLPKDYVYIAPPVATGGRGRRGGAPPVAPDAIAAEVEVTIVAERMDMVFVEARQADERLEAGTEIVSMGASRLHDRSLLLRLGVDSDGAGAGAGAPR